MIHHVPNIVALGRPRGPHPTEAEGPRRGPTRLTPGFRDGLDGAIATDRTARKPGVFCLCLSVVPEGGEQQPPLADVRPLRGRMCGKVENPRAEGALATLVLPPPGVNHVGPFRGPAAPSPSLSGPCCASELPLSGPCCAVTFPFRSLLRLRTAPFGALLRRHLPFRGPAAPSCGPSLFYFVFPVFF